MDPTKACECISFADYDLIFNHGLNDKCQVDGFDPSEYDNAQNANVFNFHGPVYGDIYGVKHGDSTDTEDSSENDSIESESDNQIYNAHF